MLKIWSSLPHKSYSINIQGHQCGIGTRDIWDQVPGAWNIMCLMWSEQMEALLGWADTPERFPFDCGFVAFSVGMALQSYNSSSSWGDLAEKLTPSQFLAEVKNHKDCKNLIFPMVFGPIFWEKAEAMAKDYKDFMPNVIKGNFGARGTH